MVSTVMKEELRIIFERLRLSGSVIILWLILSILDSTNLVNLGDNSTNFIVYATLSSASVIVILAGLFIQVEPLLKTLLKNRANDIDVWNHNEPLKPLIEKRTKISEIFLIVALIALLISFLFVAI